MTDNKELIPGMTDVINHIKKLEKENKKLEEHYANSIHTDWIAEKAGEDPEYYRNVCCADTLGSMIKENKKLEEENETLKNMIEYQNDKIKDYKQVISTHMDINEKLKEQNKKQKENYSKKDMSELQVIILELQKENKKINHFFLLFVNLRNHLAKLFFLSWSFHFPQTIAFTSFMVISPSFKALRNPFVLSPPLQCLSEKG